MACVCPTTFNVYFPCSFFCHSGFGRVLSTFDMAPHRRAATHDPPGGCYSQSRRFPSSCMSLRQVLNSCADHSGPGRHAQNFVRSPGPTGECSSSPLVRIRSLSSPCACRCVPPRWATLLVSSIRGLGSGYASPNQTKPNQTKYINTYRYVFIYLYVFEDAA